MSELNATNGVREAEGSFHFRQECIFWITAVLLLLLYLWTPVLQGNEIIHGEITREMLLSGNWLSPLLNWETLSDREGAAYWCPILFSKLFRESAFVLRLPAALSALCALYALRFLGRVLFDSRTAIMSCWMFLGSAGFLVWGRSADSVMPCTAALLLATAWAFHGKGKGRWGFFGYLIFYLFCFAGAYFRNILTVLLPGVMLLPLLVTEERWKTHLNRYHFGALFTAILLTIAILRLPHILSGAPAARVAGMGWGNFAAMGQELCRHFTEGALLHVKWYNWWSDLFLLLLPWSFLLPAALLGLFKQRENLSLQVRRFSAGFGIAFGLCALLAGALPGTLMALTPFLLLFSAAGFNRWGVETWNKNAFRFAYYAAMVCASFGIGSIICYPLWGRVAQCTPPAALVLGPVIAGLLAWGALFMDHKKENAFNRLTGLPHPAASAIFAWTLLSGVAVSVILPVFRDVFNTEGRFFMRHRRLGRKAGIRGVSFMTPIPAAYLYYGCATHPVRQINSLDQLIAEGRTGKVLIFFRNRKEVLEAFENNCKQYGISTGKPFASEESLRWETPDSRNGKYVSYLITLPNERIKKNGSVF